MSVAVVVAALVAAAGPKAAVADDPAAVVREAYRIEKLRHSQLFDPQQSPVAREVPPWFPKHRKRLFSRRMVEALERLDRQQAAGDLVLDADPFIDAQDVWDDHEILTDLRVKVLSRSADRAVVQAFFFNFEKKLILFQMVKEDGRWLIDDMNELASLLGSPSP